MPALSNVTTSDTFYQWVTKTNQIISQYNETNTLATNAYNYSNNALNNVVVIAADTTANILFSNAYINGLIVSTTANTVVSNGASIILSNTVLVKIITDAANASAGWVANLAYNQANSAYLAANNIYPWANTKFLANISDSIFAGNLGITGNLNIFGTVNIVNSLVISGNLRIYGDDTIEVNLLGS